MYALPQTLFSAPSHCLTSSASSLFISLFSLSLCSLYGPSLFLPLSLSLSFYFIALSLYLSKSAVSPRQKFLTSFSLMLAPFRSRISTTSPFPFPAAKCNGVWYQKHQKYISGPSLVNVNIPPVVKDITLCIIHQSIWKSSSSPNPCSSCHSHIQWSPLSSLLFLSFSKSAFSPIDIFLHVFHWCWLHSAAESQQHLLFQ